MKRPYNTTAFCLNCKKQFATYTWELNRGKGKYCSKRCLGLDILSSQQPIKSAPNYNKRHMARKQVQWHLEKLPCELCGDLKAEAHHDDYSKALNIMWLCRKHHMQRHVSNF